CSDSSRASPSAQRAGRRRCRRTTSRRASVRSRTRSMTRRATSARSFTISSSLVSIRTPRPWSTRSPAPRRQTSSPAIGRPSGGRFREVYYWDSYFTMQGLVESGRTDLVKGMLDNFAHLVSTVGHIPNANRTYYLSRSQPPYFAAMVGLYASATDTARALPYL